MSSMYDGEDAGPAGPNEFEELTSGEVVDEEITEGGELNHTEELAPEPVEAKPVEVSPNPTPTQSHKIFDKDYEVTPEAGYRRS